MKSFENISTSRKAVAAALAGLALVVSGCSAESTATPRASIATEWTEGSSPDSGGLVFDGRITYRDGDWSINCYADEGLRVETAAEGDTLLTLANKAGSLLMQPSQLGSEDIPTDVYAVALASINDLKNPDQIQADTEYVFPQYCRVG